MRRGRAFVRAPALRGSPWRSQSVQGVFKQRKGVYFYVRTQCQRHQEPLPARNKRPNHHLPGHAGGHRLCGDAPQQDAATGVRLPADGPEGHGHLHRRLPLRTSVRRRHLHRGGRGGDVHRQRHRPHRLHHERAGHLRLLLHRRLRLQEVPHPQGRRHRSGPGHCLPHRGDAAVELSHHAHLHGKWIARKSWSPC